MSFIELVPSPGTLTARVFENEHIGLKPTLFFDVEVPIVPFSFDGEQQNTTVRLDFINFKVGDWRELEGRTFTFPRNPDEGYIDGSIYLAHVHNPVDVTRIRFESFNQAAVAATIDLEIDFTYEGPEELGVVALQWKVDLCFDRLELDRTVQEARRMKQL